jgi:NitT/TauT family transport system ATP-binding protein
MSLSDPQRGSAPVIAFRDVEMRFGGEVVHGGLSFDIREGEFCSILGPSGCGKSTLLRIIGDLLSVSAGEVSVAGRPPSEGWQDIAYVFQSPRLAPWRNALDNVLLGTALRFGAAGRVGRVAEAKRLLELVGLGRDMDKFPAVLSGGERQRVAIARALAVNPKVILMDEPFSALDPNTRTRMRVELERIWQETGKTIVFVTHDIDEALQLADRIFLLSRKPTKVVETIPVRAPRPRSQADAGLAAQRCFALSRRRHERPHRCPPPFSAAALHRRGARARGGGGR